MRPNLRSFLFVGLPLSIIHGEYSSFITKFELSTSNLCVPFEGFSLEFIDKEMSVSFSLPSAFFRAYRRLNFCLLIACISPFLQCKRTNRFVCRIKYLRIICLNILVYLAFVLCLSSLEMPTVSKSAPTLFNILEVSHIVGNNYFLFFILACLLFKRRAHAQFFNHLNQFDRTYNKFIEPPIKYKNINRAFWIESFVYGVYIFVKPVFKYTFAMQVFPGYSMLIRMNLSVEQFFYGIALFHLKNCAHNLIVRLRKINSLLHKFLVKQQQQQRPPYNATQFTMANLFRLKQTARMLIVLLKARQRLQTAFGPVFVLIFTFNLFSIAFTAYPYLSLDDPFPEDTPMYLRITDIIFLIPYLIKDFYCMINYHILGNMVSSFLVFFEIEFEIFAYFL